MKRLVCVALASGLGLGLGCGDDGDSEGGGDSTTAVNPLQVDTGLPEATALEDVTPEQYASACELLRQDVVERLGPDRAVRGTCEVYSGALTNEPSVCRAGADACETQVNAGEGPLGITREQLDFTTFECGDVGELEGCGVTIGEFETCLEDRMAGIERLFDENDCDNAAAVDLTTATALIGIGSMSPPSCARLEQECPGIGPFASE